MEQDRRAKGRYQAAAQGGEDNADQWAQARQGTVFAQNAEEKLRIQPASPALQSNAPSAERL